MIRLSYSFFLLWCLIAACSSKPETKPNPHAQKLDSLIESERVADRFDGTIVISRRDSIYYQKAIGTANRVWNIPMRIGHRFDICSVNKSFIATLVLIAVDEGKLQLEAKLTDLLDSDKYTGSFDPRITVHHLLTHTSGIPHYDAIAPNLSAANFRAFKRLHLTNREYLDLISQLPPAHAPDEGFRYSSLAYHVLTIILENLYQTSFAALLQAKICQPLELEDTFSPTDNEKVYPHLVEGYNYLEESGDWRRNQFIDFSLGRRIFSTAADLNQWGRAIPTLPLLSDSSRKVMLTNHLAAINPDISYGYGWVIYEENDRFAMGDLGIAKSYIIHGGNTEGYKSMLVNINNGEYVMVLLANTGDRTNEMALTKKIVQILIQS